MATKKTKKSPKTKTRRGSPEAVNKRIAARALNSLFERGAGNGAEAVDGRKAKRRARILAEMKEGRGGKPLKPLVLLTHAHALLAEFGEPAKTLRSVRSKRAAPMTPEAEALYRETQATYGFDPRAWTVLGVKAGFFG